MSVRTPKKNTTTVDIQRKIPKKNKNPRVTASRYEPYVLIDPPLFPQLPRTKPINRVANVTTRKKVIVIASYRKYTRA